MREKLENHVSLWMQRGYRDGIPDEVPDRLMELNKAPSYKSLVFAIIKNDAALKTLGYSNPFSECYHQIKKQEIATRPSQINKYRQMEFNFND